MRYFWPVVDAELTSRGAIEPRFAVAMIDVCTEVLERGLDARLGQFELAVLTERSLSLNHNLGSVAHLVRSLHL